MHTSLTKILYIHAASFTNHQTTYSQETLCTTRRVWRVTLGNLKDMLKYLLDADNDNNNDLSSDNDLQKSPLSDTMSSFELETRSYTGTDLRDMLNKKLQQRKLVITLVFLYL